MRFSSSLLGVISCLLFLSARIHFVHSKLHCMQESQSKSLDSWSPAAARHDMNLWQKLEPEPIAAQQQPSVPIT